MFVCAWQAFVSALIACNDPVDEMSRFGIVPVFDVKQLGTSDDDAINCLLTALQEAIKQVQNVSELGGTDGLTEDAPEACCLCEHLDRVFLYGLREPQWGYWPWVRQFTHPAAQQEIVGGSLSTDLGHGRAWLLASLNGGLLEGYVRSFGQNPRLLRRGYSAGSFLRQPQHLDLLATVVSGLEHVPFKLNPSNPLLDDTSAWTKLAQLWPAATGELPRGICGMTVSSSASSASSGSCREEDSGILSASPAEEAPASCRCASCVALGDRERIRRIISMDVGPPADPGGGDLEVTRVVLTRKRAVGRSRSGSASSPPVAGGPPTGDNVAAPSSVGEAVPRGDDAEEGPSVRDSALCSDDRGAPDGCEEGALPARGEERCEELCSIYDSKFASCPPPLNEPALVHHTSSTDGSSEPAEEPSESSAREGLDIEVENCALLYLTLQIFGSEDEKLYKMFLAWQWVDGRLEPAYVVVTNECLYTLRPGPEANQFVCDRCVRLGQLEVVTVWLNYHGFSLTCASGERTEVATGHAELTRNILSSLDLAIRRSRRGCLPSVVSHCSEQLDALRKLLLAELRPQRGELSVRDYRLVQWEQRTERGSGPTGPTASGPLMWRFLEGTTRARHKKNRWQAAHFLLRAGVLYRFANQGDTIADATYLVSGFPCAPCGSVSHVGRPHALQLNLSSSSSGACLQLAASNQGEMERWVGALAEAQHQLPGPAHSAGGCMVACCLVLAGDLVLTLVEGHSKVLGRGSVVDLSTVQSEANFCAMEFDSGEAEGKSCARSSWLFWFATEEEKDEFLAVVSACWQEIFQVSLDISPLPNGSLRNHCLARASRMERRRAELREFCLDS